MFKQGAFVNVLTPDSEGRKSILANLDRLPSLDHYGSNIFPRETNLRKSGMLFAVSSSLFTALSFIRLVLHIPEIGGHAEAFRCRS